MKTEGAGDSVYVRAELSNEDQSIVYTPAFLVPESDGRLLEYLAMVSVVGLDRRLRRPVAPVDYRTRPKSSSTRNRSTAT